MKKTMNISAPLSTLTAAVLLVAGTSAAAAPPSSSFAESRGYQACAKAAGSDVNLLKVESNYYIYDHDDSRSYYLNGLTRVAGGTEPVKIACQTTRSGHRLLSMSVDTGRYAGRIVDSASVASY